MSQKTAKNRRVFVVHGRNDRLRRAVFDFLRAIGLEPLEWSQMKALTGEPSPTVAQIIETGFKHAGATVVILSGEDFAWLMPEHQRPGDGAEEKRPTPQPRPNVLFEAGMAKAMMPKNTVLVEWGTVRPLSDLAGVNIIRLSDSPSSRQSFANSLVLAGVSVDLTGTDWHEAGKFDTRRDPLSPSELPPTLKSLLGNATCWGVWFATEHEWHKTGRREPDCEATKHHTWRSFSCVDHAVYGPYVALNPGSYRAWFRLRISRYSPEYPLEIPSQQRTEATESIVRLDVPAAGLITHHVIAASDIPDSSYHLYCIPFELHYFGPVELRVLQTASGWAVDTDYTAITG